MVPMLQLLARVKLREAIATSSMVICVTATLGATLKLATLPAHSHSPWRALMLAGLMAPTAIIGGKLGAKLTHALPVPWVRAAITVLLLLAAARLADLL